MNSADGSDLSEEVMTPYCQVMESDEATAAFVRLKLMMSSASPDVGVGMGAALFAECTRAGLITMEEFSFLGSGFLPHKLPAYQRHNFAFVHPELTDWEFKIGELEDS